MSTAAPAPSGTMDFGRAFTSVTEDPDWIKKVLIGGAFTLLSSVLVGVPFVLGYFGRTLRNVVAGAARPLPEWDDLGGIFGEGLRLAAVYLLYTVGVFVVFGGLGCLIASPAMLLGGARSAEFDPSRAMPRSPAMTAATPGPSPSPAPTPPPRRLAPAGLPRCPSRMTSS